MSNAVPAFHTKAAEEMSKRQDDARLERERATRFLSRVDQLLAELESTLV